MPPPPSASLVCAPDRDRVLTHSGKFDLPGANASWVRRDAITERVDRAAAAKLVLVRAPAGFGKTTALRQIYEQLRARGVATAWITLDVADNDVPRFLSCLAEAIARLQIGEESQTGRDVDALALLEREGAPFALFLDEFEILKSSAVLALLREIVSRLPRSGQLVIGSRNLPDLDLGRLRVRGQLMEIDVQVLRFSVEETREFLQARGLPALPHDVLEMLHARTEGWVAALLLASMALERHHEPSDFVQRLTGGGGAIAEYLAEDVLGRQPADVREFLLRTSILRQLSPSLCQALQPRTDCARMLARLHASSLFLLPIETDATEPHYRFHSLFATFLRTQLVREHSDEVLRLHLAASAWYESVDRLVPAIDHAIEGGDFPYALMLLSRTAQGFLEEGRMRLLARWFAAIPRGTLHAHPLMQAIAIWAVLFTQGPTEAQALLADSGLALSEDAVISAHVNAQRPLLLAMQDRYPEANELGREGLARLPTAVPFADTALTNCMAHVTAVLGQTHEAQRLLDSARSSRCGSVFNRMYTESTEGMLDFERGLFRQAMARFRIAVGCTRDSSYRYTGGNAWAGVLYASAMYEADDLASVERLLNVYAPLARDVGLPDHMIECHAIRSRLLFGRGDVDGASRVLTELETLGHLRKLPRVVASARLERACMLMRQGNAFGARAELDRSDDPAVWDRVARQRLPAHELLDIGIGRLRWEVQFGDAGAAALRIAAELPATLAASRIRRAHKLRVLWAVALWRKNSPEEAADVMGDVLLQGSREGFARLILDEGAAVAGPIRAVLKNLRKNPGPQDPILLEYVQRLLTALGGDALASESDQAATTATPWQGESMTGKEMRVLNLLAEGYSNGAMAEKLFVAESTVRTHLRSINMKLAAQNRTQAVSIARRHGLIR